MKALVRIGLATTLGLLAFSSQALAGMATVTVYNSSSTALTIQDLNAGLVNSAFDYNAGGAPGSYATTTFVLDDTHTYNIGQYFYQLNGHQFGFSGGMINPLGTPAESQFFQVRDGNKIYVSGIKVTFHWVTNGLAQPPYDLLCPNSGCLNGGAGWLNNPAGLDYVLYLPPADTNFNGIYNSFQFFSSGSSFGNLYLGTNDGIANWIGTGHSFVRTGPYSIQVTTDKGNVFDITAVPEPSALGLFVLATLGLAAVRSRRAR